jgi:hypothetical protein
MENRAYYMTLVIQRWLGIRLDILGNILILGIGLFAAGFRKTIDPAKIGVVLSYTLSSKSFCHLPVMNCSLNVLQSLRSSVSHFPFCSAYFS